MNIFIDAINNPWKIILFDNNRKIIDFLDINLKRNESSWLMPKISQILKKNNLYYKNLENIVVINGPWSFTWIRSIILEINSINFIIKKNITTLSYFDLFDNYPIIKTSSKKDSFIKIDKNSPIKIIWNKNLKQELEKNKIKKIYWDLNKNLFENIEIINKIDYEKILKNLKFDTLKIAQSNYIKKPSIT